MPKRARSGSMSGSASAKKRFRRGRYAYARRYRPTYVRPGYGAIGRTPGGAVLGEMKYFDSAVNDAGIPNTATWVGGVIDPPTFNTLCCPVVGAAFNQRIGKEINVIKIKIHGKVLFNPVSASAAPVTPTVIRLGLFQDLQTNATQATGQQLMTPTATVGQAPLTFQNIDNFGRFRVLKDKVMKLEDPNLVGTDTVMDTNGVVKHFKWTVKFRIPVKIRFNQVNGGTIADIIDNSFHLYANSDGLSSGYCRLTYLSRVTYKE